MRRHLAPLVAAALALSSAATAQTPPAPAQDPTDARTQAELLARGQAYSRAPDSEQDPAEVAETVRLNQQIVANNDRAAAVEAKAEAGAEASFAAGQVIEAQNVEAEARYQAEVDAYEARRIEYERARATWEGLIAACERSGRRDCRDAVPVG